MRRLLIALILTFAAAAAQTGLLTINNGEINFAGAAHTLPTVIVATVPGLPATCTPGELAVVTGATAGQQIYECGPANVWTQQLNSGGTVTAITTGCGTSGGPITGSGTITGVGVCITVPNEALTGTTDASLAKFTGAPSTAIIVGTGDTTGAVGMVFSGGGTTGSAVIQVQGVATCQFDGGGVTAGHYVIISSSTAGRCKDGGATYPTSGQVLGTALETWAGNSFAPVDLSLRQAVVTPSAGGTVTAVATGCGAAGGTITGSGTITGVGVCITVANEAGTGTTDTSLAKLTGAPSTAIITGTGDTGGIIGIVFSGGGTTGSALIQIQGTASCHFDGAGGTAGHYVINSTATAGRCRDAGASFPTSGEVLGTLLSTVAANGTADVDLSLRQTTVGGSVTVNGQTCTIGSSCTITTSGGNVIITGGNYKNTIINFNVFAGDQLLFTAPNTAGFSNLNFAAGDSLTTAADGTEIIVQDRAHAATLAGRMVALPATPYSVTICFTVANPGTSYYGLALYDGTKVQVAVGNSSPNITTLIIDNWTNVNTRSGNVDGSTVLLSPSAYTCQRVTDNGTLRKYYASNDAGGFWYRYNATSFSGPDTVGGGGFLTPTQAGYVLGHANGNNPMVIHVHHFRIATNACTGDFTQIGLDC